jgi:hypothetical protein
MSRFYDDEGKARRLVTLDATRTKPTLIYCGQMLRTFQNIDEAHEWARRHYFHISDYIEWEV